MIFRTNNGGALAVHQSSKDGPVTVAHLRTLSPSGQGNAVSKISAGDFVQLLNLYRYIKDNDIQNAWINPHGKNKGEQPMKNELAARPVWNNYAMRTKRARVWYYRAKSAYELAARISNPPTVDDVDAAAKLLDSVQRYALADAREWEAENSSESYCNSQAHKDRQAMLDRHREKLQKRLAAYGCKLENYGLFPTVIDAKTREGLHALHYFD